MEEGAQKISILCYSDDLLHCLRRERKSVAELIEHMNDLAAGCQDHLEEVGKGKVGISRKVRKYVVMEDAKEEGAGEERTKLEKPEGEDEFKDAKETGSITSGTSKTQWAAEDSQAGTAMSAVPQPPEGEGGHQVHAAVGHGDG